MIQLKGPVATSTDKKVFGVWLRSGRFHDCLNHNFDPRYLGPGRKSERANTQVTAPWYILLISCVNRPPHPLIGTLKLSNLLCLSSRIETRAPSSQK